MIEYIKRSLCVFVLCLSLCFATSETVQSAENWPQFRGPTGQGLSTETGLPVKWSETENVRWKTAIPGDGWSSPIVFDGEIFLTTAIPKGTGDDRDRTLAAVCLDAVYGHVKWTKELFQQSKDDTEQIHAKNSHASATPITDGKHVFVHFGNKGTACLTMDGEVVWKNEEIAYSPRHGNGGSPVLVDGLLIFSCDGQDIQFVVALDATTGEVRWKKDRPHIEKEAKFSFSTPLVVEAGGKQQLVSPGTDVVVAYDPPTGNEIWQVRYDGYSVIPRPVHGNGLVYISTGYQTPTLLAIRPDAAGNVTSSHVAWKFNKAVSHTPSFVLLGKEIYFVSDQGQGRCLDAATGDVHWQKRFGGNYSASPVYGDGKLYFTSEEGETLVTRAGSKFEQLAKNQLPGRALASIAISDKSLFLRTDRELYRIQDASQTTITAGNAR